MRLSRRSLAPAGLLLALLLAGCAPPAPGSPPAPAASGTLRVVTFNIHAGTDQRRQPSVDRIGALLDSLAPDVVLLQEVDRGTRRSGGADHLAILAERTGLTPSFGRAMEFDGGEYGTAILSRLPIVRVRTIPLPVEVPEALSGRYYEPRALLHAVLSTPAGPLHVLGTHLDHGRLPVFRHTQMMELLAHLAGEVPAGEPLVLAGDLNAAPDRPEIRALSLHLRDAWTECGRGDPLTFPADTPRTRIDYVFMRGVECSSTVVVPTQVSDHRPVVVDLRLPGR